LSQGTEVSNSCADPITSPRRVTVVDRVGPTAMAMMNLITIVLIAAGTFLLIVLMP
jgi:hypothetical protein